MLILGCSKRKRRGDGTLPAIERYDGPAFRVFRRFAREKPSEVPRVLILSAEHGLIFQDTPVATYDRCMTPARARELRPAVLAKLGRLTASHPSPETLVFAGRQYLPALSTDENGFFNDVNVMVCAGALGKKLAQLHDWLHGCPPKLRYNSTIHRAGSRARIRGVEVSLSREEVLRVATETLAEGWGDPWSYQSWCVPVDGRYVAPKWLVSRISGLPVGAFTTEDARRLLAQLGVEVRRA